MKAILNEYRKSYRTNYSRKLYKVHNVESDTEKNLFAKIYTEYIRPSRYCNDVEFELEDKELAKGFRDWRSHGGVTFEMYYGNGTVD